MNKKQEDAKNYATSFKPNESTLGAEMVYDSVDEKTRFITLDNGNFKSCESIKTRQDKVLFPLQPDNDMIKNGFIKLPSSVLVYGSDNDLFNCIKSFIEKYVYLPEPFLIISSVYVMMSWVYERFHVLPYLRVLGLPGTGKTRFLEVIGSLCYKPMFAGGSTSTPAVFRTLHEIQGTLIFDEADFRNSENWSEIVKILNSGHTKRFPVMRMEASPSGKFKTRTFSCFGPKVLASRERFRDEALESRCLTQILQPQMTRKHPLHLPTEFEVEALELRNKLLNFRFLTYSNIRVCETNMDSVKIPRIQQSILSIFHIGEMIGESVRNAVIDFGTRLSHEFSLNQRRNSESDVLIVILELSRDTKGLEASKGKIRIGEIANRYNSRFYDSMLDREEREYPTNEGGPWIPSSYRVSARKIGEIVTRKLMLKTERDADGFFVSISERDKILSLARYYGITQEMLSKERDPNHEVEITL